MFPPTGAASLEAQLAVVGNTSFGTNTTAQIPCESWQSPASNNTAGGYGDVIAYPASRVVLTCGPDAGSSYTCTDGTSRAAPSGPNGSVDVHDFWSTSDVDDETGRPLARLLLHAQLQDMLGQVMPIGTAVDQAP